MRKSNKTFSTLEKYQLSKQSKIIFAAVTVLLSIIYIFLLYYENSFSIEAMIQQNQEIANTAIKRLNYINVFKNCILIILSMLVTSFISALFIDTKSKNSVFADLIVNDIFSDSTFYTLLEKSHKQNILNGLESDVYFSGKTELQSMFASVRDSVLEISKEGIYYDKCSIDIQCRVHNDYIEKTILRTVKIKSYDKNGFRLTDYPLVTCTYSDDIPYKPIEMKALSIDNKPIDLSRIKRITLNDKSSLYTKSGYTASEKYVYDDIIDISYKKSKEIKVEYITRVPLNDKTYSCRMPYACKSFLLEYTIKQSQDNYGLNTVAFGFIDDATKTPNLSNDMSSVKVSFDNWIFPYDGVAVTICEHSEKNNKTYWFFLLFHI